MHRTLSSSVTQKKHSNMTSKEEEENWRNRQYLALACVRLGPLEVWYDISEDDQLLCRKNWLVMFTSRKSPFGLLLMWTLRYRDHYSFIKTQRCCVDI